MKVMLCPLCLGDVHYCTSCERWECLDAHQGKEIIPLVTPQELQEE